MNNIKYLLIILIALLIAYMFACLDGSMVIHDNTVDFIEAKTTAEGTVTRYKELIEIYSPDEAREILINELKEKSWVQDAGLSNDGISIWWQVPNNIEYLLVTETRASLTDTTNQSIKYAPNIQYDIFKQLFQQNGKIQNDRNALVLSPYQWDWNLLGLIPLQDETQYISDILGTAGFNVTYKVNSKKSDQNVSLNDYINFNKYEVIAIASHGGVNSKNDVFISTGVIATNDLYNQYLGDLQNGNLVLTVFIDKWFTDDDILAFGITPGWMIKHYPNKFQNMLFYAGICKGLFNNTFSNAILGEGSTYFSWDESVDTRQATRTGRDLFTQLITNALTAGEGHQKVELNGNAVYNPPFWSTQPSAHFAFTGDPDLRLVDEPLKIAATPREYDDIGELLMSFGHEVTTISLQTLTDYEQLAEYDIVGINCAGGLSSHALEAKESLRSFVSNGGRLYASDWANEFVSSAFGEYGYVTFPPSPRRGRGNQTSTATVVDSGLQAYLGVTEVSVFFDQSWWVVIEDVGSQAEVLISGEPQISKSAAKLHDETHSPRDRSSFHYDLHNIQTIEAEFPLAVSFKHGDGIVVYTSFHNTKQVTESTRHILEYFTILK